MVKTCGVCGHNGELAWRDGKYYCPMCGSEFVNAEAVVMPQSVVESPVSSAVCPICKNASNNTFANGKYRCSLCGTWFELRQMAPQPQQSNYPNYNNANSSSAYLRTQRYHFLKKEKSKHTTLGIVFLFVFWPVSIYFFIQSHKIGKEMNTYKPY